MGLYLKLLPKETFVIRQVDNVLMLDDDKKWLLKELIYSGDYEKAGAFLSLVNDPGCRFPASIFWHLFYNEPDSFFGTDEYYELMEKYRFLLEDEVLRENRRVGSYYDVRRLRAFCGKVMEFVVRELKPSIEAVKCWLLSSGGFIWTYEVELCPALGLHSLSDGYYLPTTKRFDYFHYGSAVELARELDDVYSTGAIVILDQLANMETVVNADAAALCWSFKILMRHVILSLRDNMVLEFA